MLTFSELSLQNADREDATGTPWHIPEHRGSVFGSKGKSPTVFPGTAGFLQNGVIFSEDGKENGFSTGENAGKLEDIHERIRRMLIHQRKKHKEILKVEDDAFKIIVRQAESSVNSITAFLKFRGSMDDSTERTQQLVLSWLEHSFSAKFGRLLQEESKQRDGIVDHERRLRTAKQCFERFAGAEMRFRRTVEMLFRAEKYHRKCIQRAETRDAQNIPVLRPFVVVVEHMSVLGNCPFACATDCPFYRRGEGLGNPHYKWSNRGKPLSGPLSLPPLSS